MPISASFCSGFISTIFFLCWGVKMWMRRTKFCVLNVSSGKRQKRERKRASVSVLQCGFYSMLCLYVCVLALLSFSLSFALEVLEHRQTPVQNSVKLLLLLPLFCILYPRPERSCR